MSGSTMTVTVNGFVNNVPAGTDIVNVFADAGNDSLLIDATSLPMLLNGGGGEDVFRFGDAFHDMDPIDGATSIAGDSGVDRVVLDDRADNASHQWSFNTTQLARSGWGGAVYAGVETLEAFGGQAGAGDETYDVNAVAITATLTVATGDGSDTVRLAPAGNTLDAIEGALAVDGEGGSDSLVLFDRANAFDDAFTIDSEHIGRGFFGGVNYANFEVATLNAGGAPGVAAAPGSTARPADADADADGPGAGPGAGPEGNNADNVFQILSTSALTVVNGGSGNDSYLVGNGDLSQMLGDVVVDGESGTDSVLVDDNNGEIFSDAYGVTADNVSFNNNPLVSYARVEALTLEAPEGNNTIRLHSTAPTTPVTILGGGGNDVFHLTDGDLSPIDAPLVIHGGDELDTLNVNDQAATRAENYTLTATSV